MKIIHVFNITRREVEALDLSRFLTTHAQWPLLEGEALRNRMNSLIIEIDGYASDAREIYNIPEVRTYLKLLHNEWPWWSYFMHTGGNYLAVMYLCLLDKIGPVTASGPNKQASRYDPEELFVLTLKEFQFLNPLADRAGLSEIECDERAMAIVDMFLDGGEK